ncbi:MAG: aryl-sulfate sulfotransferase [Bacteroidota bacterium]
MSLFSHFSSGKQKLILSIALLCSALTSFSQTKTLGLTKHFPGSQENGYVLFSPLNCDTTYLIDKCGKKVHKWVSEYTPGLSVFLKPNGNLIKTGTYTDTTFGTAGGRGGIIEEFDWDNNLIWRYKIFNDSLCQHHDITPLANGNVLVLAWHAISKAEAIGLGRDLANFSATQTELWGERIIELKPIGTDSAEIVWQWDLFDHIIQDNNAGLPNYGTISQNPQLLNINYAINLKTNDWIHANSLDYNEELDQIVISCHNISEIWIIDHSTTIAEAKGHTGGNTNKGGDLLYRWGNPIAYGNGTKFDRKLFRQHNANWIPNGYKDSGSIMIFNNGLERDTAYSSIEVITPPLLSNGNYSSSLPYSPVSPTWRYSDSVPTKFYSPIISGAHRLPNGNTLICSGVQGKFFEVTQQKKIVWEYINPVAAATVQTDGQTSNNNSVFRCTFYPSSYAAFKNRSLPSLGTLEKNSYVYSCTYEKTAPKLLTLSPLKNEKDVIVNSTLQITFDEAVVPLNSQIKIFANNILVESIGSNSSKVVMNNKTVTISPSQPFVEGVRVSVLVPVGSFRDSSNNTTSKIDSSAWFFYIKKNYIASPVLFPLHLSTNISSNTTLKLQFAETVTKGTSGSIRLYEDGVLKQTIPVSSSSIVVSGSTVTITPSSKFSNGSVISVSIDECFKNSLNYPNRPTTMNEWRFTIISAPVIIKLTPDHKASNVSLNATLSMEFDRSIFQGTVGQIYIYENNVIKDSIISNGPRATIMNNKLSFDINTDFKENAWIAIRIKPGILIDSVGVPFAGIDTTEWNFTTASPSSVHSVKSGLQFQLYPNPNKGQFTISNSTTINSLEIYDLSGKKIEFEQLKTDEKQVQITMKQYATGQYLLVVNGTQTQVLIIQ